MVSAWVVLKWGCFEEESMVSAGVVLKKAVLRMIRAECWAERGLSVETAMGRSVGRRWECFCFYGGMRYLCSLK